MYINWLLDLNLEAKISVLGKDKKLLFFNGLLGVGSKRDINE